VGFADSIRRRLARRQGASEAASLAASLAQGSSSESSQEEQRVPSAEAVPMLASGPATMLEPSDVVAHARVIEPPIASSDDIQQTVPRGLRIAAAWSWRVFLVAGLIFGVGWLVGYVSEVTVPLAIALLLAAMLTPITNRLHRLGMPRGLAVAITVAGAVIVIAGVLTLIATQIASQAPQLWASIVDAFNQFMGWLRNGPIPINQKWLNLDTWGTRIQQLLVDSQSTIASYASDIGTQVGHFLAGIALLLFALIFFLLEGKQIFAFLLNFVPHRARPRAGEASGKGWHALSSYVRAVIVVAFVDALGVLIAALILGVPLAPALAALVFIGAFVPIVGALVSGFVAVVVALVALGWVKALIMLACIIAVGQIEGHVLQPFLLGRAVKLHPLAVIIAIAVGIIVGGIVGALIFVPMLAFTKAFVQSLMETSQRPLVNQQFR
jgi:putative heme transporter